MEILKSFLLAFVQSATEFLPISSSGHLVIFGSFLKPEISSFLLFTITLHCGSLLAIIFYFRKRIKELILLKNLKLLAFIILSSIFTFFIAYPLHDYVEKLVSSPSKAGKAMLINGLILATLFLKKGKEGREIDFIRAVIIGIAQGIAVVPGISRSGITITSALHLGIKENLAFEFSFLLSIPAIAGAQLLESLKTGFPQSGEKGMYLPGFIFSILFSFLFLKLMEKLVVKGWFKYFSLYSLFMGFVVTFLLSIS
jgi:undecaprenyl-diphosphatase